MFNVENIPALYLVDHLAGVIKAGVIVDNLSVWNQEFLVQILIGLLSSNPEARPIFGISVYDGGDKALAKKIAMERDRIGIAVKRGLKELGIASRYASSKDAGLSSAFVTTNNLVDDGADFCVMAMPDGIAVGMTQAVQDFKAWGDRDYGRPVRDTGSGMLPPKLARILVNLSGVQANGILLDPFCGSGTVLMEAALLGIKHIIGTDLSPKAVADSKKNLDWMKAWTSQTKFELKACSAEELSTSIDAQVDAVAGETYLGPPQSGRETPVRIQQIIDDLMTRYATMFVGVHKVMKPGAKAVIAFPAVKIHGGHVYLPLKALLEKIGFEIQKPIPDEIGLKGGITPNGGLLYERENQKVARDIIVMRRS